MHRSIARLPLLLVAFTSLLAACAAPMPGYERAMQAVEGSDDALSKLAGSLNGLDEGLKDLLRATGGDPGEVRASERLYASYLDRVLSARDATTSGIASVKQSMPPFLDALKTAADAAPEGPVRTRADASFQSVKKSYDALEGKLDAFATSLAGFTTEADAIRTTLGDTTHSSDVTAVRPRIEGLLERGGPFRKDIREASEALETFRSDLAAHRAG